MVGRVPSSQRWAVGTDTIKRRANVFARFLGWRCLRNTARRFPSESEALIRADMLMTGYVAVDQSRGVHQARLLSFTFEAHIAMS